MSPKMSKVVLPSVIAMRCMFLDSGHYLDSRAALHPKLDLRSVFACMIERIVAETRLVSDS